jgi:hypothetical protein
MNKQTRERVKSDLVIGFGFSETNANIVLQRYDNNQLAVNELDAISYLEHRNPLALPGRVEQYPQPLMLQAGMVETLEQLNFKITKEQ